MREILFRGKQADDGRLVYGYPLKIGSTGFAHYYILIDCACAYCPIEVDPSTVGQYTGQIDKNGVKIFEGDLVEYDSYVYEAKYINGFLVFDLRSAYNGKFPPCQIEPFIVRYTKVIGNIYDNPELMNGGTNDGDQADPV